MRTKQEIIHSTSNSLEFKTLEVLIDIRDILANPKPPMLTTHLEAMRKEFDEKFVDKFLDINGKLAYEEIKDVSYADEIKAFLTSSLTQYSEKLRVEIEGRKNIEWRFVYNQVGSTLKIGERYTYIESHLKTEEKLAIKELILSSLSDIQALLK